ncbi:Zn-ribbon domain-containing OB-fold protein [Aquihabitans sp. McL0605]|uniref:Zn-ribbon domain-containing OB-fold protein n=1 Tax=Aquihabitans sp. McL0605 TaxID=3415671 RepID=UPI003CF862B0
MTDTSADVPFRILPALMPEDEHYWTGGKDGELRFVRCGDCGWWLHPNGPVCPSCLSRNLHVTAASGKGVVHAFTINWQPWIPGFDPPYVVAIIALPEQEGLRVTSNVFGCEPDEVHTGMAVTVDFEQHGDVWIPIFRPEVAS